MAYVGPSIGWRTLACTVVLLALGSCGKSSAVDSASGTSGEGTAESSGQTSTTGSAKACVDDSDCTEPCERCMAVNGMICYPMEHCGCENEIECPPDQVCMPNGFGGVCVDPVETGTDTGTDTDTETETETDTGTGSGTDTDTGTGG